ncbi:MAG TPA: CIA30 family protein [Gemmataceae bacterium]|nr:CIA30 family protein [Gemmataceae bacterium]
MRWFIGSTLMLFALGASLMADDTPKTVFDFSGTDAAKEWQTVNDGVMGGVSDGRFKITDKKTLEFYGTLSLENNGGFASMRSRGRKATCWWHGAGATGGTTR